MKTLGMKHLLIICLVAAMLPVQSMLPAERGFNHASFNQVLQQLRVDPSYQVPPKVAESFVGSSTYRDFVHKYGQFGLTKQANAAGEEVCGYGREETSQRMANLFVRWQAINGGNFKAAQLSGVELFRAIEDIDYLLTTPPEKYTDGDFFPQLDTVHIKKLRHARYDAQTELTRRSNSIGERLSSFSRGVSVVSEWPLGDKYDSIQHLSWDLKNTHLLCIGRKNQDLFILIFAYDRAKKTLTHLVSQQIVIPGYDSFVVSHALWGPCEGMIVIGGNSADHTKAISKEYYFDAIQRTVSPVSVIHQTSGQHAYSHHAFWSRDLSHLCLVHGGECFVFAWDGNFRRFELETTVFPGLQHVHTASLSFDKKYVLTSHYEFPFVRVSKSHQPWGCYSIVRFRDKLHSALWHPTSYYFVALSLSDPSMLILYTYDDKMDNVYEKQRITVGSPIRKIEWSSDGAYLTVLSDISSGAPHGIKMFKFNGSFLHVAETFNEVTLDGTQGPISECAFCPETRALVVVGSGLLSHGEVLSLDQQKVETRELVCEQEPEEQLKEYVSNEDVMRSCVGKVFEYLDQVPNFPEVTIGSVIMMENTEQTHPILVAVDKPDIRYAHNGVALPAVRNAERGDVLGDNVAGLWFVHADAWQQRIGAPVSSFTEFSLKNVLTGKYLRAAQDHAPIHGSKMVENFVDLSKDESPMKVLHRNDKRTAWFVGESVHLVDNKKHCLMVDYAQDAHPLLSKYNINRLTLSPQSTMSLNRYAQWRVTRHVPFQFILSQVAQGSRLFSGVARQLFPQFKLPYLMPVRSIQGANDAVHLSEVPHRSTVKISIAGSEYTLAVCSKSAVAKSLFNKNELFVASSEPGLDDEWLVSKETNGVKLQHKATQKWIGMREQELILVDDADKAAFMCMQAVPDSHESGAYAINLYDVNRHITFGLTVQQDHLVPLDDQIKTCGFLVKGVENDGLPASGKKCTWHLSATKK